MHDNWNTTGAYVATVADISNIATPLDVTLTVDPGNSKQWTPLKYANGVTQAYLGYNFSSVLSSGLSAENEAALSTVAASFFPTSASERTAEILDVFTTSGVLTDADKVGAEFFAGGPGTFSPPGQFAFMWADYTARFLPADYASVSGEVDAQVLSMLDVAVHLFEGARVTWATKSRYMQSRENMSRLCLFVSHGCVIRHPRIML